MQFGQRRAFNGIWVLQNGHSLVVGAAGGGTGFLASSRACSLAIGRTIKKKTTAAIMRKLIIVLIKTP